MEIRGACYCGKVRFKAISHTPYPYMRCYCGFCRRTAGSGGFAINIMAQADTLRIEGEAGLAFHHGMEHDADTDELKPGPGKRYFCRECGSPLWAADPRWPQWFYPYASAIDTPLPTPPEQVHIMLDFAAPWADIPQGKGHRHFRRYPDESIEQWHRRHGLYEA